MRQTLLVLALLAASSHTSAFKLGQATRLRDEADDQNVQIQNIYGIPTEEEKQKMKAKEQAKKKKEVVTAKKDKLKAQMLAFSKSLKESDFDESQKTRTDLIENEGESATSLDKVKITTTDIYRHQF